MACLTPKAAKHCTPKNVQVFGKPNVLVNNFELENNGKHINRTMDSYTAQEFVELADNFSAGKAGQSIVMKKIFAQIEKEKNENEFNRT